MKKKIISLLILVIGLGLYSCSSDEGDTPETKMQTVSFEFPEFAQSVMVKSTLASPETAKYSFNYYVFTKGGTKDGDFVKTKWFPKGEIVNIKDTLPPGNYYISIFASTANSLTDDCTFITMNYKNAAVMHLNKFSNDILYETFELTVANEAIQQPVTLQRIVSKIEVVIEDVQNMPADITSLYISSEDPKNLSAPVDFDFKSKSTGFADHATFLSVDRSQILKVNSQNPLSFYIFPTSKILQPFGISVTLLKGASGNGGFFIGGVKVIKKNIKVDANQTLRLSGKLFDNNIENNVRINDTWGTTVEAGFDPL